MYRMQVKELIEVLQAYEKGEQIEFRKKHSNDDWFCCSHYDWDFNINEYRIKPKKKKLYKYAYIESDGTWKETECFYGDGETDFHRDFKRLDYTMIEVDEE